MGEQSIVYHLDDQHQNEWQNDTFSSKVKKWTLFIIVY